MSPIDADLDHLYPDFRAKVQRVLRLLGDWCQEHLPGYRAEVNEGFRTQERQVAYYAQGRTAPGPIVTKLNGTTHPSNHQSGMAADIVWINPKGVRTYAVPDAAWAYFGHLCRGAGLVWGGDWDGDQKSSDEKFVDTPHVEWPTSDRAAYQRAQEWKAKVGLK